MFKQNCCYWHGCSLLLHNTTENCLNFTRQLFMIACFEMIIRAWVGAEKMILKYLKDGQVEEEKTSLMWKVKGTRLHSAWKPCGLVSLPALGVVCLSEHWAIQIVVPGPVASGSPGNVLEMQILRPYLRSTESQTLGFRSSLLVLQTLQVLLMFCEVWDPLPWRPGQRIKKKKNQNLVKGSEGRDTNAMHRERGKVQWM